MDFPPGVRNPEQNLFCWPFLKSSQLLVPGTLQANGSYWAGSSVGKEHPFECLNPLWLPVSVFKLELLFSDLPFRSR